MKQAKKYLIGCLFLASAALLLVGLSTLQREEKELSQGQKRQVLEEELAEEYIQQLQRETTASPKEELPIFLEQNQSELDASSTLESTAALPTLWGKSWEMWATRDDFDYYVDENGLRYTPDYAQGTLQFVLEIPSIRLCRGVYGGTAAQISHDLAIWMLTLARERYELGETAICIYGHNSVWKNLSFHRLHEVNVGTEIYIYSEKGTFVYEVSEIFALEREECAKQVLDNTALSANQLFLVTCGKGAWEGKNRIVAATRKE